MGIVAVPEAGLATLSGIFDVLNSLSWLAGRDGIPPDPPFRVELLGEGDGPVQLASGITLPLDGAAQGRPCDLVIVPSLFVRDDGWTPGRYPGLVRWILERHGAGATICSACSGLFLIAETGLFDGVDATIHWPYARMFTAQYPAVRAHPDRALIVAGPRGELVSSGASTSWHDLVLYLIGREAGPAAAQAVCKVFALQRHVDGLAPFMVFDPPRGHGDALVEASQAWLDSHASVAFPVREMVSRSGLSERGFSRRFQAATGHSPLDYVQHLRVEHAKRRLERTLEPIEQVAWAVGYEDPSAFRRLFARIAGISPGQYRRQFAQPDSANGGHPDAPPC
ncbi:GlxA family transcriptional regulator [Paracoccus benzoatiresistens]|uniref:Helix-turn-helix domain-containing protein n=1 Tax=Paracoccus benzoatiresistens TaxID=2997341 RepID=A0ABT4J916_9RHOB|nr:helix-turn-helix domain-containing protein [Paracoccus sp. EF6]MCZ0963185.1 helix-turn-helix domain-containing protein [Paracoccus sp. EF6]